MKLKIPLSPKFQIVLFFFWLSFCGFAQNEIKNEELSIHTVLKKASKKYEVVFNYNYKELKNIYCQNELPNTLNEFKDLVAEYTGLELESFDKKIWIIRKNYTHQIQCLDAENNPISGVTLESYNKKSNRFGNLFLKVYTYPQRFVFKYQNYEDKKLDIDNTTPQKVVLNITQFLLDEVVVNNLYINGLYLDSNKHIKVKTKYTPLLAGQVQQDAFISLLNLPQVSTTSESITELNIKGGLNDQNLVLWNGIKIFQNAHFFGLLSAFNDNLIETITVIDNATPAQYGNALSGTIKLDFDSKYAQKNRYGIGVNALSSHAFVRQQIAKDFEFSFAIQRSFTDVFKSATFESYREKVYQDTEIKLLENQFFMDNVVREDVFYYQDAQFQLKKVINTKLDLSIQGIWFENDLNYSEKTIDLNNKNSSFNNVNAAIGINARYSYDDKSNLSVIYNFSKHQSKGNNNTFTGNLNTFQKNVVDNYFLQANWAKKKTNYKYTIGADFDGAIITNQFDNEVTSAFLNLVQIGNVFSFFSDFSYQYNQWQIYTGLRLAHYQRDKQWRIEPRFNVSYKLSEVFELSLRGEKKSQNLKQIVDLDQNFLGIEKRRWFLTGQNELQLQDSNQIETLLQFDKNKFGGYASLFLRTLKGLSSSDQRFQNENEFDSFQNGIAQIMGSTLHLYYKTKTISSWISFAYLKEKITTPEKSFNGNNNINHHITWGNNLKFDNWNFSFSFVFHDGLPYTSVNQANPLNTDLSTGLNSINYNNPNSDKLPGYFRMDTSIQYHYKKKKHQDYKFSLGIINLTDYNNVLRKNYRLNRVDSNQIQIIETLGLGFTPNIGLLCSF